MALPLRPCAASSRFFERFLDEAHTKAAERSMGRFEEARKCFEVDAGREHFDARTENRCRR